MSCRSVSDIFDAKKGYPHKHIRGILKIQKKKRRKKINE